MRTLMVFYSNVTAALVEHVPHERVVVLVNDDYQSGAGDLFGTYPHRLVPRYVARDADDPLHWYEEVSKLIHDERTAGHDVDVDLTAGKKPMSLGAYAAAEFHSAPSAYLKHVVPGPRKEPTSQPRFEIKESVNLVSIRNELGLDWLTSADNAFRLGRFDAASALYERANEAKAPGADVLLAISKARQAWLEGHYVIAEQLWPSRAGHVPHPWTLVAQALASSADQGSRHPFELEPAALALWLHDRKFALDLRRKAGHAPTDVAREAWLLIEEVTKVAITSWLRSGASLQCKSQACGSEALHELTLGNLLQLICDKKTGDLRLEGVSRADEEPIASLCHAIRGPELPKIGKRRRYEGLEIRNRIAHGGIGPTEAKAWLEFALDQRDLVAELIRACLAPSEDVAAPSALEDPEQFRKRINA